MWIYLSKSCPSVPAPGPEILQSDWRFQELARECAWRREAHAIGDLCAECHSLKTALENHKHGGAGVSTLEKVTMMVIRLGQVLLLSMVSMAAAQTTAEEKWRHALMASQIFVSGAGGAHIAASSTLHTKPATGQTASYTGLVATSVLIEVIMLKNTSWKWKALAIVGNLGAGIVLVNMAHNGVSRGRHRIP